MSESGGQSNGNSILRGASSMGAATFLSRILGLVREQVFAVFFGAGNATDAFNIAFRIPNLLRDLFAEGAMSSAFVPTFVKVRESEGAKRAWRVATLVMRVILTMTIAISVAGIFFAENLVDLYASAYREVPGKFELTVLMTQVLFPFFPFIVAAALFMAVLNSSGIFFLPALGSALFNATSIVVGLGMSFLLPTWFDLEPIVGMAIGVVAGGFVQAAAQVPSLFKVGFRFRTKKDDSPSWYQDPALQRMLLLLGPGVFGLAAAQINILVNSILATGEGAGAVSWLNYAFRLMMFPIGVFGVSIAVATLPRFSEHIAKDRMDLAWRDLNASLRTIFAINLPAAVGLAVLGVPIVRLIFEYGQFTADDTQATAMALQAYALGLSFYSCVKVLVPICYALKQVKLAIASSVLSVLLNLGLNLWLVEYYSYWGLALGTSFAMWLNTLFLYFMVARRVGSSLSVAPEVKRMLASFFTHLGIAAVMGALCAAVYLGSESWVLSIESTNLFVRVLVRLAATMTWVLTGVLAVVGLARAFRVQETTQVLDLLIGRIKKRL